MPLRRYRLERAAQIFRQWTFVKFIIVGVINTVFSYSFLVFLLFIGVMLELATLGALLSGILFSYQTQGRLLFDHRSRSTFFRFLLFWAIIYVLNLAVIRLLMSLGLNPYFSGAIAVVPNTVLSFFFGKLIVFRDGGVSRDQRTRL